MDNTELFVLQRDGNDNIILIDVKNRNIKNVKIPDSVNIIG